MERLEVLHVELDSLLAQGRHERAKDVEREIAVREAAAVKQPAKKKPRSRSER